MNASSQFLRSRPYFAWTVAGAAILGWLGSSHFQSTSADSRPAINEQAVAEAQKHHTPELAGLPVFSASSQGARRSQGNAPRICQESKSPIPVRNPAG